MSHVLMLLAAAGLALVTLAGGATPWVLLGLTFALGVGSVLTAPSWQAIVPELVEPREVTLAAALAGVNHNLARAIGPALGGVLVAAAGPGWTFVLNAISFLAVVAVLAKWRRPPTARPLGPEHIGAAIRSGLSYGRHAPALRAIFVRAAVFVVFAGALWAVLPVFVRADLHLGSGGYGLLLAAVGAGAVLGAALLPRVQALASTDHMVVGASVVFGTACAICALLASVPAVVVALVLAGAAWITATSSLNGTAITVLPTWVSSRGLALYTVVFQGGQTVSAVAWGVVAQIAGVRTALGGIAAGLVVGIPAVRRWRLPEAGGLNVAPDPWPVADLAIEPDPKTGPILVEVEYRVPPESHDEFRDRMRDVGRARQRTGAERWGLFQDGSDPDCFVEDFLVATWEEHLRQHHERSTLDDRAALKDAVALTSAVRPLRVRHLFFAYED
jgi:MFS family permease